MIKKISNEVSVLNKIQIYLDTLPKIIRGTVKGLFFRKRSGLTFIGDHVKLMNSQNIEVGRNVKFESYSEIQGLASTPLVFGDNVTIIAENHNFQSETVSIKEQGVVQKGIIIENDVWIGANVTILDGVHIQSGVVIGANTLVTKNIPRDTIIFNQLNRIEKTRYSEKIERDAY